MAPGVTALREFNHVGSFVTAYATPNIGPAIVNNAAITVKCGATESMSSTEGFKLELSRVSAEKRTPVSSAFRLLRCSSCGCTVTMLVSFETGGSNSTWLDRDWTLIHSAGSCFSIALLEE